ncbi:MAG: DUF881 domain-containing protein [Peptococcaceae bacterium]|nr:DUF881 domain-containing protein [Peptococcaceae bacterium]
MSLFKQGKWLLPSFVVAIALGILIAIQFQVQQKLDNAKKLNAKKIAISAQIMDEAVKETQNLENEQKALKQKINDLSNKSGGISPSLKSTIRQVKIFTGETPVQGPGIHIEIDDRKEATSPIFNMVDNFQGIVNDLKVAGAEAIAINGQRIGPRTAIVMSGSANILINGVPITRVEGTHWDIDAIGDPDTLQSFANLTLDSITSSSPDVIVTVSPEKNVVIPGLKAVADFASAQPGQ